MSRTTQDTQLSERISKYKDNAKLLNSTCIAKTTDYINCVQTNELFTVKVSLEITCLQSPLLMNKNLIFTFNRLNF